MTARTAASHVVPEGTHPAASQPWWRTVFSFEAAFTLLCFVGAFKGAAALQESQAAVDLTLLFMGLTVAAAIGSYIISPRTSVIRSRPVAIFVGFYFLFLLYAVISYLLGDASADATRKIQRVLVFDTWFLVAAVVFIDTPERLQRFLRVFIVLGILTAAASLVTAATPTQIGSFGTDNYHALGRYSAGALLICVAYVAFGRSARSPYLIFASVLLIALMISGARHAILSTLLTLIFIVGMTVRPSGRFTRLFRFLLITSGALVMAWGIKELFFDDVSAEWSQNRIQQTWEQLQGDSITSYNRFVLWAAGWEAFMENPIFGLGFGGFRITSVFRIYRHAHNMVLEYLSELGLIGFGIAVAMFWQPIRHSLRKVTLLRRESLALASLFWFELLCAQTSGDIAANRLLFTMAGLFLVSIRASATEAQPLTPAIPNPDEVQAPEPVVYGSGKGTP